LLIDLSKSRPRVLYLINNLIAENVGNIFTIARTFFTRVTDRFTDRDDIVSVIYYV